MTTGGAKVEATHDGYDKSAIKPCKVKDMNDGTYTIKLEFRVVPLYIKINGTPMKGSPF